MSDSYLKIIDNRKKLEKANIKKCNEYTSKYGLILSDDQINSIIEQKIVALQNTGRVEIRGSIIDKIIYEFCDSPFISQDNYVEILYELIDIFYNYKNDMLDLITDDELLKFMKKYFDGVCQGDLEYLSCTALDKLRRDIIDGKSPEDIENLEDEEYFE